MSEPVVRSTWCIISLLYLIRINAKKSAHRKLFYLWSIKTEQSIWNLFFPNSTTTYYMTKFLGHRGVFSVLRKGQLEFENPWMPPIPPYWQNNKYPLLYDCRWEKNRKESTRGPIHPTPVFLFNQSRRLTCPIITKHQLVNGPLQSLSASLH